MRALTDTNAKATRDAIEVDDVLLSIDGKDACTMWHHEVQTALAAPPGTVKKLRVRRAGATIDLDAPTAELL